MRFILGTGWKAAVSFRPPRRAAMSFSLLQSTPASATAVRVIPRACEIDASRFNASNFNDNVIDLSTLISVDELIYMSRNGAGPSSNESISWVFE